VKLFSDDVGSGDPSKGTSVTADPKNSFTVSSAGADKSDSSVFRVTYLGNGADSGTVPVDPNLYPEFGVVSVAANPGNLARTDYTFMGWSTIPAGQAIFFVGGESVKPSTIPISEDLSLYACWLNSKYVGKVTYDANWPNEEAGLGLVPIDPFPYYAGSGQTSEVLANPGGLAKSGYKLLGWSKSSSNTIPTWIIPESGDTALGIPLNWATLTNVVLYAVWEPLIAEEIIDQITPPTGAYQSLASTNWAASVVTCYATSFIGNDTKVTSASFMLRGLISDSQVSLVAQIYASEGPFGNSLPVGDPLTESTPILIATIPNSDTLVTFRFDGTFQVNEGTIYFLAIRAITSSIHVSRPIAYVRYTDEAQYGNGGNRVAHYSNKWGIDLGEYLYFVLRGTPKSPYKIIDQVTPPTGNSTSLQSTLLDAVKVYAQASSFVGNSNAWVSSVDFMMRSTYAGPESAHLFFVAAIWAHDGNFGNANPTGLPLAVSAPIAWSLIPLTYEVVRFEFDESFKAKAGIPYFIGVYAVTDDTSPIEGDLAQLWYTDEVQYSNGGNRAYQNLTWSRLSNQYLYFSLKGRLDAEPDRFTVIYDATGADSGTAPPDSNEYEENESVTVLANPGHLVRLGYRFLGWAFSASTVTPDFVVLESTVTPSSFVMPDKNVVLYAVWEALPTYTVTYNANWPNSQAGTGTTPTDSGSYLTNTSVTVQANSGGLSKEGYRFLGWDTTTSAATPTFTVSGSTVSPSTFLMGSSNVVLFAVWQKLYRATYKAGFPSDAIGTSGSVPFDALWYAPEETLTIQPNTGNLSATDYVLTGWNYTYPAGAEINSEIRQIIRATGAVNLPNITLSNTLSGDVTITGVWQKLFQVSYNANIPQDASSNGTVPVDTAWYSPQVDAYLWPADTITVLGNTGNLLTSGYIFRGWAASSVASVPDYTAGSTFTQPSYAVTLYGVWEQQTFSVTYNGNGATGGTVPIDSNVYTQNASVTVLANTGGLVCNGYIFKGWDTNSNATTPVYAVSGNTVTPPSFVMGTTNVVLYAVWALPLLPTYSVTYHTNGATGGTAPVDINQYEENATVTVAINSGGLVRTNYTFRGWAFLADAVVPDFVVSDSTVIPPTFLMAPANVMLYAVWEALSYTVTYDANWPNDQAGTGSVPLDSGTYTAGTTVTVCANTGNLAKAGYSFLGWAPTNSAPTPTYTVAGSTVTPPTFAINTANVTLYAVWNALPAFTVIYNANWPLGSAGTGTAPTDSGSYLTNTSVTVAANTGSLAKTGYRFLGWDSNSNAITPTYVMSGSTIVPPSFVMGSNNVVLFAIWETLPTYTVTYEANWPSGSAGSGSVPIDGTPYNVGNIVTVRTNTGNLVKNGYMFLGWDTNPTATIPAYEVLGSTVTPSTFVMPTDNVVLFAVWEKLPAFTVTYHANWPNGQAGTGTVPIDLAEYEEGRVVGVATNTDGLACVNYTFVGWAVLSDASAPDFAVFGAVVVPASFKMGPFNVVLYAVWQYTPQPVKYTVSYHGNGATSGSVPVDGAWYLAGDSVVLYANAGNLTRSGYLFLGWSKTPSDPQPAFTVTGSVVFPSMFHMGNSNVVLYAVWGLPPPEPDTYRVTYQANGAASGSVPLDDNVYLPGAAVTVQSNAGNLARPGYVFVGWSENVSDLAPAFTVEGPVVFPAVFNMGHTNVTLFAIWILQPPPPVLLSVSYAANWPSGTVGTGSVPVDTNQYINGDKVTVATNSGNLSVDDYKLLGWSTTLSVELPMFHFVEGGVFPDNFHIGPQNVVLFAIWQYVESEMGQKFPLGSLGYVKMATQLNSTEAINGEDRNALDDLLALALMEANKWALGKLQAVEASKPYLSKDWLDAIVNQWAVGDFLERRTQELKTHPRKTHAIEEMDQYLALVYGVDVSNLAEMQPSIVVTSRNLRGQGG